MRPRKIFTTSTLERTKTEATPVTILLPNIFCALFIAATP